MTQPNKSDSRTVKVVICPDFGGGWSSWQPGREQREMMLFDDGLIAAIEAGKDIEDFMERFAARFGERPFTPKQPLAVVEVLGPFRVHEYDGAESIVTWEEDEEDWWNR